MLQRAQHHSGKLLDLGLMLLLFLMSLVFFSEAVFVTEDQIIFGSDFVTQFRPMGEFTFDQLRKGTLPLWNPYLFLGFPQFAEPQFSTFYPPMWLVAWLPSNIAFGLLYAFHFGLAAAGGFILIRQLDGKRGGALLGGFIIGFNSFMTARIYAGHTAPLMTIAFLPWCLAGVVWFARRGNWRRVPLVALPLALAVLAGSASFLPPLALGLVAMVAWQIRGRQRSAGWQAAWRLAIQYVCILLFAVALASVQVLPSLQFWQYSDRVEAGYRFASSYSFPLQNLLTIAMPFLLSGDELSAAVWNGPDFSHFWEFAVYSGVMPLFFIWLSWRSRRKETAFWMALIAIAFLMAIGPAGGLHRVLFKFIPGFSSFRAPARFALLYCLSAGVITGIQFDRWFDSPPETRRATMRLVRKPLLIGGLGLIGLSLAIVAWQARSLQLRQLLPHNNAANDLLLFAVLVAAVSALLFVDQTPARPRWQVTLIALGILLVDLWGVGARFIAVGSTAPQLGWIMADLALPEDRANYRLTTNDLWPNVGYFFGFYNVSGYEGFRLKGSHTLYEQSLHDVRVARLLSVRYSLYQEERLDTIAGWERLTEPAGVIIDVRDDAMPRAFIVQDIVRAASPEEALRTLRQPNLDLAQTAVVHNASELQCETGPASLDQDREAQLVEYGPTRVVIQTSTGSVGWLVLNDAYYPGWKGTVDGQAATLYPTDYGLRGLCLPAGQHTVVLEFQPSILVYGFWLSALATAVTGVVAVGSVVDSVRRRRQKGLREKRE